MKMWLLLFAFISCVAVAQDDDGSEPFDSGIDDWGFEEGGPPKGGDIPPPNAIPPAPPPGGNAQMEAPRDLPPFSMGGGGGGGFSNKSGKVQFHPTGIKRIPAQKKNWLELKKSLMQ